MEDNQQTKILTIKFNKQLSLHEVPFFRGAVIAAMGKYDSNLLFHNHDGDENLRYSYPLIQYKIIDGKAAIVSINDGTTLVDKFLNEDESVFKIGNRVTTMKTERVFVEETEIRTTETANTYLLRSWLPLNGNNYNTYRKTESLIERIALLERILIGNLLSVCKGLGIHIDQRLCVTITACSVPVSIKHKGTNILSFDIEFKANINLPDFIGIGKNASLGYGVITKKEDNY